MKQKDRKGFKNVVLLGFVVLIVICAVVITLVAEKIEDKFNLRWDVTDSQIYSIGDTTKALLKDLDKDITVYTTFQSGQEELTIREILKRYKQESGHIKTVNVDPVEKPFFLQQYETDGESIEASSLIIQDNNSEEFRVINGQDLYEWELSEDQLYATGMIAEQRITAAIASIQGGSQTTAYFVTGHGEMNVTEEYYLADTLESDGYKVASYDLVYNNAALTDKDCLLFLSPTTDLTDEEYQITKEFIDNGGRAVYLINLLAGELKNFGKLFEDFGLILEDDLIVEADSKYYLNSQIMIKPELNEESPALRSIIEADAGVVLPRCRGISVEDKENIELIPIAYSSESSYGKVNPYTETLEKEEGDTAGPFLLGVTAENSQTGAKMLLMGNNDFVSTLDNAKHDGNIALFMDSVAWTSGKEESVVIQPKTLVSAPLNITSTAASYRLKVLVIAVIPILILIFGSIVWRRRLSR